jgi:MscS family membrane protein
MLGWVLLLLPSPAGIAAEEARHPLEPPDLASPRGTMGTFLDAMNRAWEHYAAGDPRTADDIGTAIQCLDMTGVAPSVLRAQGLKAVIGLKEILDRIELPPMSDIPGPVEISAKGLDQWVIPHTEIRLVRSAEGSREGKFLFPPDLLERLGEFYLKVKHLPYQPGKTGAHAEELRFGTRSTLLGHLVAGLPLWAKAEVSNLQVWQWASLALLVTVGIVLFVLAAVLGRRWSLGPAGLRRSVGPFAAPLGLLFASVSVRLMLGQIFVLALRPTIALTLTLTVIAFFALTWLLVLILSRVGGLVALGLFREARPLTQQLVRVIFRIATLLIVLGIAIIAAQRLGFPVTALVAGLGVGGLAIALAAQGTLENLIGGVILYADQPVRIGDFCRFGNDMGTIEAIGLRSVKIRTLGRTIVNIPNAQFARMQLETFSARDRILLSATIRLRYETTRQQLADALTRLEEMLRAHPRIAPESPRVRFVGLGEYALEIELWAYALTTSWPDFLGVRQEILLRTMQVIEDAGARLAVPTAVRHVVREADDELAPARTPRGRADTSRAT